MRTKGALNKVTRYKLYKIEPDGSHTFLQDSTNAKSIGDQLGLSKTYICMIINGQRTTDLCKLYHIEKVSKKDDEIQKYVPKRHYYKLPRCSPTASAFGEAEQAN